MLAAGGEQRLGEVILAVKGVAVRPGVGVRLGELGNEGDRLVALLASRGVGVLEGAERRGRAGQAAVAAAVGHVAEAAVGVLAGDDVVARLLEHVVRHAHPRRLRRQQAVQLPDRDRHVRVVRHRLVAPAALLVLRLLRQRDGLSQHGEDALFHGVILRPGVRLGKKKHPEPVAVHRPLRRVGREETAALRAGEDQFEALVHFPLVRPAVGRAAGLEERDAAERCDGGAPPDLGPFAHVPPPRVGKERQPFRHRLPPSLVAGGGVGRLGTDGGCHERHRSEHDCGDP